MIGFVCNFHQGTIHEILGMIRITVRIQVRDFDPDHAAGVCSSNINIRKYVFPNEKNTSNFHPLDVVGRGSETQFQGDENLNQTT